MKHSVLCLSLKTLKVASKRLTKDKLAALWKKSRQTHVSIYDIQAEQYRDLVRCSLVKKNKVNLLDRAASISLPMDPMMTNAEMVVAITNHLCKTPVTVKRKKMPPPSGGRRKKKRISAM